MLSDDAAILLAWVTSHGGVLKEDQEAPEIVAELVESGDISPDLSLDATGHTYRVVKSPSTGLPGFVALTEEDFNDPDIADAFGKIMFPDRD